MRRPIARTADLGRLRFALLHDSTIEVVRRVPVASQTVAVQGMTNQTHRIRTFGLMGGKRVLIAVRYLRVLSTEGLSFDGLLSLVHPVAHEHHVLSLTVACLAAALLTILLLLGRQGTGSSLLLQL